MPDSNAKESNSQVERILRLLGESADHFAILGVGHDAPQGRLRDAYFSLAKMLHPDLPHLRADPEAKERATKAFKAATIAHQVLSNRTQRSAYLQSIGSAEVLPQSTEPNPDLARIYVHRARQLITRRSWPEAVEHLRGAVTLYGPQDSREARALLGWAIFNDTARAEIERVQEAKEVLDAVVDDKGEDEIVGRAHYYLAMWNKTHGDMRSVKRHLDAALKLDPRNIEAQRERRLLERRRMSSSDNPRAKSSGSAASKRRVSRTTTEIPASDIPQTQKVTLKKGKKPGFFEKLFGKR